MCKFLIPARKHETSMCLEDVKISHEDQTGWCKIFFYASWMLSTLFTFHISTIYSCITNLNIFTNIFSNQKCYMNLWPPPHMICIPIISSSVSSPSRVLILDRKVDKQFPIYDLQCSVLGPTIRNFYFHQTISLPQQLWVRL